jgi:hypothetical protein
VRAADAAKIAVAQKLIRTKTPSRRGSGGMSAQKSATVLVVMQPWLATVLAMSYKATSLSGFASSQSKAKRFTPISEKTQQ